MGKRERSARGDLIVLLVLDLMCIAEFCWVRSWGPAAHPPVRPWMSGIFDGFILRGYPAVHSALSRADGALAGPAEAGSGRER